MTDSPYSHGAAAVSEPPGLLPKWIQLWYCPRCEQSDMDNPEFHVGIAAGHVDSDGSACSGDPQCHVYEYKGLRQ